MIANALCRLHVFIGSYCADPAQDNAVGRALPAIVSLIVGHSPTYFPIVEIDRLGCLRNPGPEAPAHYQCMLEIDRDQF